jgi:hypothetical protein
MKALLKDNVMTVFLPDGSMIVNKEANKDLYMQVITAETEQEVRALIFPELSEEENKILVKKDGSNTIDSLIEEGIMERIDNALYRKGIKLSIPELVLDEYISAYKSSEDIKSKRFPTLDNFWKWLSLCPNAESREDLYKFLNKHGMRITPQGMVLAYRRVVTKHSADTDKIAAISNLWVKVKTVWKYNPNLYSLVVRNEDYKAVRTDKIKSTDEKIGNLDELYRGLADEEGDQFTDAHTKTYDYKIGVENRMDRSQGNQSNQYNCSTGFHLASKHYNYSGFGDEAVLCVFNPMDTLAVPQGEDGKLRVCAFTILSVLDSEEENSILDTADLSDMVLEHYEGQVDKLESMLTLNTPYELSVNNILSSYQSVDSESLLEEARKSIEGKLIMLNE